MVRISRFFSNTLRKGLFRYRGVKVAKKTVVPEWHFGGEVPKHVMDFKIPLITTEQASGIAEWLTTKAVPKTRRPTKASSIDEVVKTVERLMGAYKKKLDASVLDYRAEHINAISVLAATEDPQTRTTKKFLVEFAQQRKKQIEEWARRYGITKPKVENALKKMQLNPTLLNEDMTEKQIAIVLDQGFRGFKFIGGSLGKLTNNQKQALVAIRWMMA